MAVIEIHAVAADVLAEAREIGADRERIGTGLAAGAGRLEGHAAGLDQDSVDVRRPLGEKLPAVEASRVRPDITAAPL